MSDDSDVVIVEKEDGSPPADEAPVVNAPEPASQPQSAPPAESSLRQRNAPAAAAPVKSRDDDDLFIAPAQSTAEVLARLASLKLQIDGELANPTPAPKHDPQARKRALFAKLELLRLDYVEQPNIAPVVRAIELKQREKEAHLPKETKPEAATAAGNPPALESKTAVPHAHEHDKEDGAAEDHAADQEAEATDDMKAIEEEVKRKETEFVTSNAGASETSESTVEETLKRFDDLANALALRLPKKKGAEVYLRLLLALAYFLLWMPVLFLLAPLRWLNPTLRRFGIRNHFLPIDMLQKWFAYGFLHVQGIKVYADGLENIDTYHSTVGMFSHGSNLDPFIVASGPLAFKWVGKKVLFRIPILGWLFNLYGHIGIDRGNRASAIKSLSDAVSRIHKWGRSIAISPEGTRSKTGQLLPFKQGPFHLATQVKLPVTPILILGAHELWPPGQIFAMPGNVFVRALPRIEVGEHDDYRSLGSRVRRAMLRATIAEVPAPPAPASAGSTAAAALKSWAPFWGELGGRFFLLAAYVLFGLLWSKLFWVRGARAVVRKGGR